MTAARRTTWFGSCLAIASIAVGPELPSPTPAVTHGEEVRVDRVVVNTHVLGTSGSPIVGLGILDFRVEIDGQAVPLESAEWIDESSGAKEAESLSEAESVSEAPGRLIVLLFQWEIAHQKQEGFVRMQRQAMNLIASLQPTDRVAVALFSSRLWLLQDFISDRRQISVALRNIFARREEPQPPDREPSLSRFLPDGGRDATSIEKALLALGAGLQEIPGYKSLILFGWGAGTWQPTFQNQRTGFVRNSPMYGPARRALNRAETAVFCLDISDGDHGLAAGLERVAFDTGGFYLPTYLFPRFAIDRVSKALRGYYELVVPKPAGKRGSHQIVVRVRSGQPSAIVLHRSSYDDGEEP